MREYSRDFGIREFVADKTFDIEPQAAAPAGTSQTVTQNEDQVRTLSAADFGFTDADGNTFAGVQFTSTPTGGTLFYGSTGSIPIAITSFPTSTYSAADIAAGFLTFVPTTNLNGNGAATISFAVVDNGGPPNVDPTPDVLTINLTPVNDAPSLINLSLAITVGENAANATPQLIDGDVTFNDVEGNVSGGSVAVSGLLAEDRVAIRNQGTAVGQIGVSGNDVMYGNLVIGTFTGGAGGTLTVTLNGNATGSAVEALIENLTYQNVSDTPTSTRTLRINVTDAEGADLGTAPAGFTPLAGTPSDPFPGIDVGGFVAPSFVDLDGDGDLDAVIGTVDGTLASFRNNGPGTAFTALTGTDNPFSAVNVGFLASPAFVDLDGDGDKDALIGNGGSLIAFRNNGPNTAFTSYTGTNPISGSIGNSVVPTAVDFDTDGDLDIVVGTQNGLILAFRNNGPNLAFTQLTGAANPFNSINTSFDSRPAFVDLDGDGDLDLAVGTNAGTIRAFRNNGAGNDYTELAGAANPFTAANTDVGFVASPTFVDLDGDGRLDLVAGNSDGFLFGFGNISPVTLTVTAQNDAPTVAITPLTAATEQNALSLKGAVTVADVDAGAGVVTATLTIGFGVLDVTVGTSGATILSGNGTGSMVISGTIAQLNALLNTDGTSTLTYTANTDAPPSSTNFSVSINDNGNIGGPAQTGSDSETITINAVNDAPSGADSSDTVLENAVLTFTASDFSTGFADSDGNAFGGVRITTLPATGILKLSGVAIIAGADVTLAQLDAGNLTYEPAAGSGGTAPTFTFQVRDSGGIANGGVDLDQSPNTFTLNVGQANVAPVLDLDASGAGTGFASAYAEGGAAAAISDTDVLITDANAGDMVEGATITISNAVIGDVLTVAGALPGSIAVDPSSTATNLILTGTGTQAQYEVAIEQITFSNTSEDPTAGGTNISRTINVAVTDGDVSSNVAVATISVADDNADAPSGTSATITAIEDTFRLIQAGDLGFSDVDGTFASVTISSVTGGGIYFDADGSAGGGAPVLETLPKTYTAQELIDGKVSFKAAANVNGSGIGTITFAVTDDDGNTDGSQNLLTVDVTPVNDSPVLTTGGPIAATEQIAVAILPAGSVADVDLDARNGGNGNYAGASFSVNRNPATSAQDVFTLVAAGFTIDGSNLKSGGLIFGTISVDGSAGLIVVNFTSLETVATSALVDAVIQSVRYSNISDDPPASVDLAVGFDDGSPGGGQGPGATDLVVNLVTVNIAAVNDRPVVPNAAPVSATEQVAVTLLPGVTIFDAELSARNGGAGDFGGSLFLAQRFPPNPDEDRFSVANGAGFTVVDGFRLVSTANGLEFGQVSDSDSGIINISFTSSGTPATSALVNAVVQALQYTNISDTPPASVSVVYGLTDGSPGNGQGTGPGGTNNAFGNGSVTVNITAVNDAPVNTVPGAQNGTEDTDLVFSTGNGNAITVRDPDAANLQVTLSVANGVLTLSGTTGLSFGAGDGTGDSTMTFTGTASAINAALNGLVYRGNLNFEGSDALSIVTSDLGATGNGGTLTDSDTIQITLADDGRITGSPGNDGSPGSPVTGTPQDDFFDLRQGGDDNVSGQAGNDGFYFGAAYTSADVVDGGAGTRDQIGLQGDYSGGVTLGSLLNTELVVLLPGDDARFGGQTGTNLNYNIIANGSAIVSNNRLTVQANTLRAGENLTFNGSASSIDFLIYGGLGTDNLTGGSGNDGFFFGQGRFGASDVVNGGAGTMDQLGLQGNFTVTFGAAQISGMEFIVLLSASDNRFGSSGGTVSYDLTMNNANVAAGQTLIISANTLTATETLTFNGSAELDGRFEIFSGGGNDVITGGSGNDLIFGGGRGDTLTGGAGNDIFAYRSVTDSNSTERDGIQDFNSGDRIDLSLIDANSNVAGNQDFTFVGNAAFSNTAGELRFENISLGGPIWLIQGDVNGDGVSDLEIVLVINPADPITVDDFIGVNAPSPQEPLKGGVDGTTLLVMDAGGPDMLKLDGLGPVNDGGLKGRYLDIAFAQDFGGPNVLDLVMIEPQTGATHDFTL